jgi:hypothetical protein
MDYPDLQPANFLLAADPFYPAVDAEVFYTAELTPSGGWQGPNTIAIRRKNSAGNVNLILFTIELHKLDKLKSNQNQVIRKILRKLKRRKQIGRIHSPQQNVPTTSLIQ